MGLGLRSMDLVVTSLATKLYWRWCKCQDQDWAKILVHKYFLGADYLDIPRLMLDSWDGHPPILSSFSQLQTLCHIFTNVGWVIVEHFKMVK